MAKSIPDMPRIPLPKHWATLVKNGLLHAIGLERLALLEVRAGFDQSPDPRARLVAEVDTLRGQISSLEEEIRIKDARLKTIPANQRPHYPPVERLAILMLRARTGWNTAQTARRFLVTPHTIARWMLRLDDRGDDALVQTPVPVNRFDDVVTAFVQKAHAVAPGFGRRKLAELLCRAGVVLASSTVRRMLQKPPPASPKTTGEGSPTLPPAQEQPETTVATDADAHAESSNVDAKRVVSARYPHHLWHADITRVGINTAWWVPWWPFSLIARWALCWHIAIVQDHFSRAIVAFEVFRKEPTGAEICGLLDNAVQQAGCSPRHMVTDKGAQYQDEYRNWCQKHSVKRRFGALGKKGSIAVIERLIKTLKVEYLRKILLPLSIARMRDEVALYQRWYNTVRPHSTLGGATPAERLAGTPAEIKRLEPRARYPLAQGATRVQGKLELHVSYLEDRRDLPVFEFRDAA